ncbi:MAG: hypothetical protein IE889_02730 [Campylobacterales bacterium]|nr:hypothetical protein [Campylobacterales bacterium]
MVTIPLKIENSIYEDMVRGGVDIQKKFNEFLSQFAFVDDGYPTIGTEEAKRRVAETVEHYRRNPEDFTPFDDAYWDSLDKLIDDVEAKA